MSKCAKARDFFKQFSWSNWRLNYDNPEDFYLQRWQTTTQVDGHYLIFRLVYLLSISFQIHLLSRFTVVKTAHIPYIYFTHWTFVSMGVYALAHLILVAIGYTHQQSQTQEPYKILEVKILKQITMVLANIAHNCAVCVTLCFWSAFWTQEVSDLTWACKMYHSWMAVIIIWNYVLMSIPLKLEHAYLPFGFGLAYSLFSVGFYLSGGVDHKGRRYIYKLVDWGRSPWIAALVVLISMIIVLLVQILLFWLDRLKFWIYRRYFVGEDGQGEANHRGFQG